MQPGPNPRLALLALTARLIAAHGSITMLDLADLADVSHDVMRRALDELMQMGAIKFHGIMYKWPIHATAHTLAALEAIAAGTFKRRGAWRA